MRGGQAAALLPAAASCSGSTSTGQSSGEGGSGAGGGGGTTSSTTSTTTSSGVGGSGAGGSSSSGTAGAGGGGVVACDPAWIEETFTVEVPPAGTPATPGQICAGNNSPVTSNPFARVTLAKYSQATNLATGFVEVEPSLLPDVVGLPTITAVDAWVGELLNMQVTQIASTAGGFSFHVEWPLPFNVTPESFSRVTVQTSLQLTCGPNKVKTVESITYVHMCIEAGDIVWVAAEIAALREQIGIRVVFVQDDLFILPSEKKTAARMQALTAALRQHGADDLAFWIKGRPESITAAVLEAARERWVQREARRNAPPQIDPSVEPGLLTVDFRSRL